MRLEASAIVDGGRAPSDAPGAAAKRVFALEGQARTLVESAAPLYAAVGMPFSGRGPVDRGLPGGAAGRFAPVY